MSNNACDKTKYIAIVLVICLIILAIMHFTGKPAENFQFVDPIMTDNIQPMVESVSARPNLKAPLEPRSNLPGLSNGSLMGDVPASNMGAAPPQPVMMNQGPPVDFSTMGAASQVPYGAMTSSQAGQMLQQKMNGGAPQYNEPTLPLGDIHSVSVDPTNPQNFMYNRTVFAPLKRRYGNGVDHFRGDIDVKQEYRGWYDISPATDKDIVTGYFDRYIDIQQQIALKDAQFSRSSPIESVYNSSINPAGDTFRMVYTNI